MALAQLALFVLLVHVIVRPIMAAYLFTRPPRLRVAFRTPRDWGAAYRDVEFSGGGGIVLSGWYLPSRNGATVILLHGHSGNRLATAYHAEALSRAGYGVLMFDLRAHGDSGGRRFVRGVEAIEDVMGAVAFVSRQPDVASRIGVMGISVGGMLAIQAAGRTTAIRAVAADGPTLGCVDDLPPAEGLIDRLWRYPMERYYQAAIDWFSRSVRPPAIVSVLSGLARRPILLISTGAGLERRLTRHYYQVAPPGSQWWEIPRASHAAGWAAEPEAYAEQMVSFFDRALSVGEREQGEDVMEPVADDVTKVLSKADEPPHPKPTEAYPVAERTVSPPATMMIAFAVIPLSMLLLFIPYQLRWGFFAPRLPAGGELLVLFSLLLFLAAGLIVHEVAHLFGYRLFGGLPRGVARLCLGRFPLSPQVCCDSAIRAGAYRRILLFPALILGLLPGVIAVAAGWWVLLVWSVWMLVAAGGDFAALWAMRGLSDFTAVRAHPSRAGCLIYDDTEPLQNIDK